MMLYHALLILPLVAQCHSAALANSAQPATVNAAEPGGDTTAGLEPLPNPGYVRMPLSKHKLNGTEPWKRDCYGRRPPGARGSRPLPPWCVSPGSDGEHAASDGKETATVPPWSSFPTALFNNSAMPSTIIKVTKTEATQATSGSATSHALVPRQTPWTYRWGWSHLAELEGGTTYTTQLEIGTPPQKVKVLLDTGSYELWVNPNCQAASSEALCQSNGFYYPNKSSTATRVPGDIQLIYGTGGARGSYWSDTMNVALLSLPKVQFAVANDSYYLSSGIMGLGYAYPYTMNYPSVLDLMVSQNKINAPIFSVGLGGTGDNVAEIIFGGVNLGKFRGRLQPVKIWPAIKDQDQRWLQYFVNVTAVGLQMPNEGAYRYTPDDFTMRALLDTGAALSYFRSDLVDFIASKFSAAKDPLGNYAVDCAWHKAPGTMIFGFGQMLIGIPFKDFILQTTQKGYCLLGVQPVDIESADFVLGNSFLRGAYLVFDQESDVVWMAEYNNCGDGVQVVGQKKMDVGDYNGMC